jgi:integrase
VEGSFYALRHTFRAVADELPDQPAINFITGHTDSTMAENYRQRIADDRLITVADHVRSWLLVGRNEGTGFVLAGDKTSSLKD